MKVLVTGHLGFVGSHVVPELESAGHEVVGLDVRSERPTDVTEFDLLLEDFPEGVDCVVHLAAKPGVGWSVEHPAECWVQNVVGTENVLRVARLKEAKRVVFASSSTVYGDNLSAPWAEDAMTFPLSPYGESKLAAERACAYYGAHCGLSCAVLRLFSVYGPRMREDLAMSRLAASATPGGPAFHVRGNGLSSRDYTYAGDVARAFRLAAESGAEGVFNVCGGKPRTLREVVDALGAALGKPPDARYDRPAAGWEPSQTWGDNFRARSVLGWTPTADFRDGVDEFAEWWRSAFAESSMLPGAEK